jgi:hypothetical protein
MNDMSKIGDSFPLKIKRQFVRNRLQRGLVIKVEIPRLIESPIKICGDLQSETLAKMEEAVETNRTFSNYEKKILIGPLSIPMF